MNRDVCEHFTPIDLHCDHCADKHTKQPMTTMTEQERELDFLVAELEQENRLLRARNQRLERELADALASRPAAPAATDSEGGEHD